MNAPRTPPRVGTGGARPARVVVIGAGIAGLTCASRLLELSRERARPLELIVLEAARRPGGVIDSEHADGFLMERGPDCFITEKPWALELCRRIGLQDEITGTNEENRRSFVLSRGRLRAIPEGYQIMAPARFLPFATTPILSLAGKLRAACDLVLPRGSERDDESLASFVSRRFGPEVLERLAQPLLAGIYNADPERLSLRATMPRFLEMERSRRSIILALMRARRLGTGSDQGVSGARYSLFVTLRGGLRVLIERLANRLPSGALHLGEAARDVAREGVRWRVATGSGETIGADAVVVAMPANAAAPLLRSLDSDLSAALATIAYGTSVTVNLGYREVDLPPLPKGFGFVVPRSERLSLIGCSFSSMKFPGRARQGTILLRNFLGGPGIEGADPERLERAVRDDLRRTLGITAAPIITRTAIWPRAMAQYEVRHLEKVASIESRLSRLRGLALAGNGLRGIGIPDCVRSGERAAETVATVIA